MGFYPAAVAWDVLPAQSLNQVAGEIPNMLNRVLPPELSGLRGDSSWDVRRLMDVVLALLPAQSLEGLHGGPIANAWVETKDRVSNTVCLPGRIGVHGAARVCQLPSGYFSLNVGQRERAGGQRSCAVTQRLLLHRFLCYWQWGAPPAGQPMATHRCGHADCLNPLHLVWASAGQNARTRVYHQAAGRGWWRLHTAPVV